ncbi:Sister chromatid cohesion protein DCC1 [Physocladia obscura]|uniref:Sister chromatid cohesion protein DCC1 n=1 Tax=Physocladia obscura TaxID=109957 RepID=A0AAD5TAP6_9FUNG|nr:Sister chromatid cohesion protein DCC1 [Physocladia obscura]
MTIENTATLRYPALPQRNRNKYGGSETNNTDARCGFVWRLLQLPADIAPLFDSEANSSPLTIRGSESADAVITSDNATFALKLVQTSNTLMIVSKNNTEITATINPEDTPFMLKEPTFEYTVEASVKSYIEMEKVVPTAIDQLHALLAPTIYCGPYKEQKRVLAASTNRNNEKHLEYTLHDLGGVVQASRVELNAALNEIGAVEIGGVYRLVSPTFLNEFLHLFIASVDIDEKDYNAMINSDAVSMMADNDIPEEIILHCFHLITDELKQGSGIYKLSGPKICRFEQSQINVENFMDQWSKVTPSIFKPSLDYLQGLYILDEVSEIDCYIKYFPKSKLPAAAKERLEQLFHERRKWKATDIMPYIKDLAENSKKLDLILLKYGRVSKIGNIVYYTSRF